MINPTPDGIFDDAEAIRASGREQAIADGVLVDVTPIAKQAGFTILVALTAAVRARLEPSERDARLGQSFEGRLQDVLMRLGAHVDDPEGDINIVIFDSTVVDMDEKCRIHLKAFVTRSGASGPVVIIMFLHETMDLLRHLARS